MKLINGRLVHEVDVQDGVRDVVAVVLHVGDDGIVQGNSERPQIILFEALGSRNEEIGVKSVDVTANRISLKRFLCSIRALVLSPKSERRSTQRSFPRP